MKFQTDFSFEQLICVKLTCFVSFVLFLFLKIGKNKERKLTPWKMLVNRSEFRTRGSGRRRREPSGRRKSGKRLIGEPLIFETTGGLIPADKSVGVRINVEDVVIGNGEEDPPLLICVDRATMERLNAEIRGIGDPIGGPNERTVANEALQLSAGTVGEEILPNGLFGRIDQFANVGQLIRGGIDHHVFPVVEKVAVVVVLEVGVELAPRSHIRAC